MARRSTGGRLASFSMRWSATVNPLAVRHKALAAFTRGQTRSLKLDSILFLEFYTTTPTFGSRRAAPDVRPKILSMRCSTRIRSCDWAIWAQTRSRITSFLLAPTGPKWSIGPSHRRLSLVWPAVMMSQILTMSLRRAHSGSVSTRRRARSSIHMSIVSHLALPKTRRLAEKSKLTINNEAGSLLVLVVDALLFSGLDFYFFCYKHHHQVQHTLSTPPLSLPIIT